MRKLIVLSCLAAIGCGGSAASGVRASGTVGGTAFSPAEIVAAQVAPASCALAGLPAAAVVAAVAVRFATFTGTCADLTAPTCRSHRSSRSVTLVVATAATTAAGAAVGPGAYTVVADSQFTLGPGGSAQLTSGNSTTTDAQCADTTSAATGSLRLDEVSGARVAGHVDVSFADGGKLQGDFIAPVCPFAPDACTVAATGAICSGTACL